MGQFDGARMHEFLLGELGSGPDRIDGRDPAGMVSAVVDPIGRFIDIHLAGGCAGRVGTAGRDRAVVESLVDARSKA
ncbi:hypothetical protein, partial [Dactylosporangium fulvum]|uniref:hypothetical protein n=1 Tax=Dactylosporangium fulvum TaxID=53359 RepID=UPI0031E3C980